MEEEKKKKKEEKKFKILSLDGGGIRGVLSARLLKEVETILKEKNKGELHEYFDLIAGTSTGSILAAGIACHKTAEELIQLYQDEGNNIFLPRVRWERNLRLLGRLFGSNALYPHKSGEQGLANVLKRQLIHKELGKSPSIADIEEPQLLILAYNVLSRYTEWFANDDPTEWYYKNNIELWKICTASASAPTYFPPYNLPSSLDRKQDIPHIDGGVSANNPELPAIAHALCMKRKENTPPLKIEDIAVLSIGTGQTTRPYTYTEIKNWGLLKWVANMPNIFLNPPAINSEEITKRMFLKLEHQNYLRLDFRLNKTLEKGEILKKPYNEYLFKKKGEKIKISEDIDDPELCKNLIEVAECYLDCGDVHYKIESDKREYIKVRDAIEQFIDSNDQ